MILTDAGPLVAILDQDELHHDSCVQCLAQLAGPLLTTWPVLAEAMYLLGESGGWRAQDGLWRHIDKGNIQIAELVRDDRSRMRILMEKYRDLPMDLADASLVVLAENEGLRDIFTLDHADFRVYRIHRRHSFRLWPKVL
jgi:hypothetical protein